MALKKISKSVHAHEADIAGFFASESRADDPRNHCIRLIRILQPPGDEDTVIFVMPLLRPYDSPRFDTIGEVVEFFRQVFEVISPKKSSLASFVWHA